ncbi:MAG: formylmethanofuran dehydrogenase subunit A [Piscinibacter sp.]|uniref:formylmethanofuran dehydrogenase subunit A n=1 Tax=Piscinibacter sp. TaxID=1903157 RepID=UPI00258B87CD|nr:formylmethanofuran dehydrogenase subunit A [Piscinibacter sp.]MCW5664439.1 formylmethanofuran dehydrogenase subunit A [Piscinibacter sp.]
MSSVILRGGTVVDPIGGSGVRDLAVRDGRIVAPRAGERYDREIDAAGCVVMAGGIDLHTHIGGGKVNLARLLMAEDHRQGVEPIALPGNALELASCGTCAPGTLATGYRYVEMGYTAAFEPAMVPSNARHAHMEMGDVPVLDHGAYVMLGSDELFLELLAQGGPDLKNFDQIRDYTAWTINASKAMGVKVVNPGGISAFKFNQRKLDVNEPHVHWQVTPRQVVHALARALKELGVPHPLHIHGSNLGVAGNIRSTLETIEALEGLPAHLTHIQFHAYGTEGPKKFSSAALQLAEAVNANPQISIDVGQIMFGQTVTASGDTMRQFAQSGLANPRKWVGADIELMAGCGVVPFRYREQSFVNALQWVIGLEIFLLVKNPWQVVLTTDHPNGGPFTSYPHLIRLLMDRSFREEQLAKLHPEVAANCALKSITRELTLEEIAILTRAAPAKLLGLPDRGQLGVGAAADIAVYREKADRESMFRTPEWVFKDGVLVAQAGRVTATPVGGTHFVEPGYDPIIEKTLRRHWQDRAAIAFDNVAITHDELCSCCNGGRLLPAACFSGDAA